MLFDLIAQNNKLSQQLALMREKVDELNTVSALYKHFETRIEKQSSSPAHEATTLMSAQINPLCGAGTRATTTPTNSPVKRKTPNTAEICQDLFGTVDDEVIFEMYQKTSESPGSSSH